MRKDLPPYVRVKRGGSGKIYLYFERRGVRTKLPAFDDPDFWVEYARAGRGLPQSPTTKNWRALVAAYKASERYSKLSPRTRKDYEPAIVFLTDAWGDADPRKLKRSNVIAVMHENAENTRKANDFKVVVSRCLDTAIDMDWMTHNVAKTISHLKPKTTLNRQPWPQDLIDKFREEAPIGTRARLIFELCLGTGQRISDVLSLRWSDIRDEGVHLVQRKTGRALVIPYTATLRDTLAQHGRNEWFIVAGTNGKPVSYRAANDAIMRVRKCIGAEAYDIHGLRHTAASELAEAGCSDDLIKAVTGHHSTAMVRRYSDAARQRSRAKEAQDKRK